MAYKIIVSPQAQKEIENAIDYYALYSTNAPKIFVTTLNNMYNILFTNPFLGRIAYKDIRAFKLNKFPYSLYFDVNETKNKVKIIACFHNKRNPNNRPNY